MNRLVKIDVGVIKSLKFNASEMFMYIDPGSMMNHSLSLDFDFYGFFEKYKVFDKSNDEDLKLVTIAATYPWCAYLLTVDRIGYKCPELEPVIIRDAMSAAYYSFAIMNERWIEAEPIIKKNKLAWTWYRNRFYFRILLSNILWYFTPRTR